MDTRGQLGAGPSDLIRLTLAMVPALTDRATPMPALRAYAAVGREFRALRRGSHCATSQQWYSVPRGVHLAHHFVLGVPPGGKRRLIQERGNKLPHRRVNIFDISVIISATGAMTVDCRDKS
jgi:hypothetical protein